MSDEQPGALAAEVFRQDPERPRALTPQDLPRLARLGFLDLARRLAAGTCPKCGLNRLGVVHRDLCAVGKKAKKADAQGIRQPWEPGPPRDRSG